MLSRVKRPRTAGSGKQIIDLSGKRFGRLTVIKLDPDNFTGSKKSRNWICVCDCGVVKSVGGCYLRKGSVTSCGCRKVTIAELKPFNYIFGMYKSNAKKQGVHFELSKDEFSKLATSNCYYCGAIPNRNYNGFIYNGIALIESEKGYVFSNSIPCCDTCKTAKNVMNHRDFIAWICKIYEHNSDRKMV